MYNFTEQFASLRGIAAEPAIVPENIPVIRDDEELMIMGDNFRLDDFQVVRREFFAHMNEPSITFNQRKFYVNTACLNKFPNTNYVQALINTESKILALRPCNEGERGAFQWCSNNKGARKPRHTTCTLFFLKIFDLMDWNTQHRYKMLGNIIHANGEYLLAFDLTSTEVYQRTIDDNDTKIKSSKIPVYPLDWQNQFGLPYNEHKQSMLINIFDGYAIYQIKENKAIKQELEKETGDININHQNR